MQFHSLPRHEGLLCLCGCHGHHTIRGLRSHHPNPLAGWGKEAVFVVGNLVFRVLGRSDMMFLFQGLDVERISLGPCEHH